LAVLINSLVRNGFHGTLWAGWRDQQSACLHDLPASVRDRIDLRLVEVRTPRPLANYKPDFIETVWDLAGPEAASVTYMDCDLVLGCAWSLVRAWVQTGLAIVEDQPGRSVGPDHPLRQAWMSFMSSAGVPAVRTLSQYFNSGFIGIPAACRPVLKLWSALGQALEGISGLHDQSKEPYWIRGVRSAEQTSEVPEGVLDMMRPFLLEDQDALNMAIMASNVPLRPMGPDAMGFTADRTPIIPHAIGPSKPWSKAYLRKLIVDGEGPSFADDQWWCYSDQPIHVARGWRMAARRSSWRSAKALKRLL
jgi:hypothetical protein